MLQGGWGLSCSPFSEHSQVNYSELPLYVAKKMTNSLQWGHKVSYEDIRPQAAKIVFLGVSSQDLELPCLRDCLLT